MKLCYIDTDSASLIFDLIVGLVIFVIIFLIVRSILLWYWKIDVIVKNQEEQIILLKQMVFQQPKSEPLSSNIVKPRTLSDENLILFTDSEKNRGFFCSLNDLSSGTMWPAAKNICSSYNEGGFENWRLPTKEELKAIYETLYKSGAGGFSEGKYWSSTEFSIYDAIELDFSNGNESATSKSSLNLVRAVRSF